MPRHAVIDIDLDAITSNAAAMARRADGAVLCAVVKADGYGHGAVAAARAALDGGAEWLAVALVEEGEALRAAGLSAPILVLSQPPVDAMVDALRADLVPTLYTAEGICAAQDAVVGHVAEVAAGSTAIRDGRWTVHLKVDTGMHRVGADPEVATSLAERIRSSPQLALGGTFTHLAVADDPAHPLTERQLERFDAVLAELVSVGIDPGIVHAANSAGAIAHPGARRDLVRVGIALYGVDPSPELADEVELVPAMTVRTEVTLVRDVERGEGVSYGMRHVFDAPATVAVVPLGYADGVPRRLGLLGAEVLIGGVRRPIRGVVTMDQFVVEVTGGPPVQVGDEVVLLGRQGDEQVAAQEWATMLDTIAYEIVCGFGVRLPRAHRNGAIRTETHSR